MHEHEYLLLDEIAAIARTSIDTVRRWIRSGQLPSVKPGRRRLVRRGELERFLARDTLAERKTEVAPTTATAALFSVKKEAPSDG